MSNRLKVILGVVAVLCVIGALTSKESPQEEIQASQEVISQVSLPKFTILEEWSPCDTGDSYGASVLLNDEPTKENVITLVKGFENKSSVVGIKIYSSEKALRAEEEKNYQSNDWKQGYLAYYVKNTTDECAFRGSNEIRWMQEEGKFSELFGQKTQL